MEKYLVSARKYRPSTFASVVGQKALTTTLKNAVATHRLAHSYLFCGSRGVGKTSCARIFAKTINCQNPTADGEACNECASCQDFNRGTSMNIVELDAASNNGVEDIRNLVEQVQVAPTRGQYRVFIVDEVHMLTPAAFNAFLKTLEEPPSYVVFILATTEKQKIIPTILSRCQIYDFHRITIQDMIDHLGYVASQEGITAETAALNVIARKADGAMRDALSIFDQVAASSGGNITYRSAIDCLNVLDYEYYNRLLDCFLRGDVLQSWTIYKEIRDNGFDSLFFINGIGAYMRDLMVARNPSTLSLIEAGDETRQAMAAMAARCTPDFLYRAMCLCNDADLNYRTATNKQFLIELTLAKICQLLSPSPNKDSNGEGQLKPIAAAISTQSPVEKPRSQSQPQFPPQPIPEDAAGKPQPIAPRPVTVPCAQTPTSRPAATGTSLKVPHLSIRGNAKRQEQMNKRITTISSHRSNPFQEESLMDAWNAYIATHPHEHILINTMRSARPTLIDCTRFVVTVQNQLQYDMMEERRPDIIGHMRDSLQNDGVDYEVKIDASGSPRHALTDSELLEKMKAENPELKLFIEDFKLHLA